MLRLQKKKCVSSLELMKVEGIKAIIEMETNFEGTQRRREIAGNTVSDRVYILSIKNKQLKKVRKN